jgi:hypothetical protein
MAKQFIWCGFLEAGDKSSPVVRDDRLETGNPDTLYLFNFNRNEIIQYNRHIVEPKLRELRGDEEDIVNELKAAYSRTRRNFKLRSERVVHAPGRRPKSGLDRKDMDADEGVGATETEFEATVDEDWAEEESD